MAQYIRSNPRDPYLNAIQPASGNDSRNPSSGARNTFIEWDPGNPWNAGVPQWDSYGTDPYVAQRDPTGLSHTDKQNVGRQQHLDEAAYNAQMNFYNNGPPEWYFIPPQNQPYYLNQLGPITQANASRDASIYGSQAGVQSTGITANAAIEKAKQDAAALLGQTQLQTGAAERISQGRNDVLGPLFQQLGGAYGSLANQLPGALGGLASSIGGWMNQGNQGSAQAAFNDPYKRYLAGVQGGSSTPNDLLAKLRGSV